MLLNSDQLAQVERQLDERGAALQKQLATLDEALDAKRQALRAQEEAQLREAPREAKSALRATHDRARRKQLADTRRKLAESSAENRQAILSKLDDYEQSLNDTIALHSSPVQVLSRAGLGKTERSELLRQLEGAGPAELRSAADLAQATNDEILGGVVLTIADRDRRKHSQFDRTQFAQDMVGDRTAELRHRLEAARVRAREMREANQAFERGGESSTSKISRGLAKQRLEPKGDEDLGAKVGGRS